MVRTGIQLYTLREMDATVPEILDAVGKAGYDSVEFAYRVLEDDTDVERCAEVMDEHGLEAAAAHVSLDELEDGVPHADAYETLGVERLVLAYLGESHFESEMAIAETAELLDDLAFTAAEAGFELGYHNHDHELVEVGGEHALETLMEETSRVVYELDIGWTHAGGADPAGILEDHGAIIPMAHVTDVSEAGESAELGEGEVDYGSVMPVARRVGVEWYIYENDDPEDLAESLAHGAHELRELL